MVSLAVQVVVSTDGPLFGPGLKVNMAKGATVGALTGALAAHFGLTWPDGCRLWDFYNSSR